MPDRAARRFWEWLTCRVDSFRGAFLLLAAVGHIPLGISWVTTSTPRRDAALSWLPGGLDGNEFGWVWLIAGFIMLLAASLGRRDGRWTTIGFTVAFIPAALWGGIFTVAAVQGLTDTAWATAFRYFSEGITYMLVAGWPNPTKVPKWTDRLGPRERPDPGGDRV